MYFSNLNHWNGRTIYALLCTTQKDEPSIIHFTRQKFTFTFFLFFSLTFMVIVCKFKKKNFFYVIALEVGGRCHHHHHCRCRRLSMVSNKKEKIEMTSSIVIGKKSKQKRWPKRLNRIFLLHDIKFYWQNLTQCN